MQPLRFFTLSTSGKIESFKGGRNGKILFIEFLYVITLDYQLNSKYAFLRMLVEVNQEVTEESSQVSN